MIGAVRGQHPGAVWPAAFVHCVGCVVKSIEFDGKAVGDGIPRAARRGNVVVAVRQVFAVSGVTERSCPRGIILDDQRHTVGRKDTAVTGIRTGNLELESRGESSGERLLEAKTG